MELIQKIADFLMPVVFLSLLLKSLQLRDPSLMILFSTVSLPVTIPILYICDLVLFNSYDLVTACHSLPIGPPSSSLSLL